MMLHRILNILVFMLLLPLQMYAAKVSYTVVENDSVARARAFDYYYIQAISMREAERYDEAFDLFEHCLALQPTSSVVQYELYSMYRFLGRDDEALRMIESASAGEPENYWYRCMLADAYEAVDESDRALEVYVAMSHDFSSHSEIFYVLYRMFAEKKEYDKAIEALNDIERIEGRNEQTTLQKYRIYSMMEEYDLAIQEIQNLMNEYPDESRFRLYLGPIYEMMGNNDRAFEIYKAVLDEEPDNLTAQVYIADYYINVGNDSLYTQTVEQMLMNPRLSGDERTQILVRHISWKEQTDTTGYNIQLLDRLMKIPHEKVATAEVYLEYLNLKNVPKDSLVPLYNEILLLEPENLRAQLGLLEIAIEHDDSKEVIMRCNTAILYNPEILELYFYKGISCYREGLLLDAIETLTKGLEVRAEDYDGEKVSNVYSILGDIYHEAGNIDACIQAYDSALVYDSSNLGVLNNYAYFLVVDGGNLDKAEEMSLATIKAEPENTTYLDTYMWILFNKERYQEAKAYAEKLLAIEDENADKVLLHHCGDVYAKCGDIERAVELWKRAQAAGDDSKILTKKIKKRKYYADKKKKR